MAGPLPSADIVSLAVGLGLILFLDSLGFRTKNTTIYIAALMLAVYCDADVIANGSITYSIAQLSSSSTFFTTFTINGGLWAIIFSIMVLVTFMLLFDRISPPKRNE